jgi:RNA 3'-terminal phosphate cyclase (ATP)
LRTALALSAVRGVPVEIHSIRARRKNPGLQAQHLTVVTALAEICGAQVEGAALGSERIQFRPGPVRPGEYRFDVGTAGSTALVLQALLVPLALADGPSRITLTGGTHVPWSPPAHYLTDVLLPTLGRMGIAARVELAEWGFYPKGGGQVTVQIDGNADLRPINLVSREDTLRLRGISAVANLSRRVAERQRDHAKRRLAAGGREADIAIMETEALSAGSFLMLVAEMGNVSAAFSALGERGKPAEQVAEEVLDALSDFLSTDAACDPHLADQLILPLAFAPGTSRFTFSRHTRHLSTSIEITRQLLGCPVQIGGEEGHPGHVTIEGVGDRAERRAPSAERGIHGAEGRDWGIRRPGAQAPRKNQSAGAPECPSATPSRAPRAECESTQCEIRHSQFEMGGGPVVRKARVGDVPGMQKLIAHFAARSELLPRTLTELYEHLRDFFVCEVDGEVVGICALSLYWEDLAEIRTLAVQETHGGKGIGSALVKACIEEASGLGVRRIFTLTYRPGYFERFGFATIDKQELPQKIWKDCIKCAKFTCCDETALIRDT